RSRYAEPPAHHWTDEPLPSWLVAGELAFFLRSVATLPNWRDCVASRDYTPLLVRGGRFRLVISRDIALNLALLNCVAQPDPEAALFAVVFASSRRAVCPRAARAAMLRTLSGKLTDGTIEARYLPSLLNWFVDIAGNCIEETHQLN